MVKTGVLTAMKLIVPAAVVLVLSSAGFGQVKVATGDVEDSRRSDGFFNRVKIELKFSGPALDGAKGIRVSVTRAGDDTGKDLMPDKEQDKTFQEIGSSELTEVKVNVELKSPERRATTVREVAGTVEIFSPAKDPKATIIIPNFQRNVGTPLANAALKAAGLEVTVWTKPIFEARKKADEEKMKKELEEKMKKTEGAGGLEESLGAITQGLMAIFGGLMNSFASMEENDLAFNVKDPGSKLIVIVVEDSQGKTLEHGGRMTMGGGADARTTILGFKEKLPANARLKLQVLTPSSIVKSPFKLTAVPLP